jgi:hypothetical protein
MSNFCQRYAETIFSIYSVINNFAGSLHARCQYLTKNEPNGNPANPGTRQAGKKVLKTDPQF